MVDTGIKKIKINKSSLPAPIGDDSSLYYDLRYRILSEDKNRTSHWSNLERVFIETTADETGWDYNNPLTSSIPNTLIVDKPNHSINFNWTMPALLIENPTEEELLLKQKQASIVNFDIYVQWRVGNLESGESAWSWLGTITGSNYLMSYSSTTSYDHVRFRVQKVTQNKEILNVATYAITDWYSV